MSSLYIKYRPATFDEMVGNKSIRESVENMLSRDVADIPHAWLFAGASGVGKTTIARIIAKKLGATASSTFELNAADTRGIDAVRELINNIQYLPVGAKAKCYIIDECHQLTKEAQNALLKPLEDTPPHTFFILLTTEPGGLISAIRNRCKSFTFLEVSDAELKKLGKRILSDEEITLDDKIFDAALANAGGSPRLFLNMLETASSANTQQSAIESIDRMQSGVVGGKAFEVASYIFDTLKGGGSQVQLWTEVATLLNNEVYKPRVDLKGVRICLANKIHSHLLYSKNNKLGRALEILIESESSYGNAALTNTMYKIVKEISND